MNCWRVLIPVRPSAPRHIWRRTGLHARRMHHAHGAVPRYEIVCTQDAAAAPWLVRHPIAAGSAILAPAIGGAVAHAAGWPGGYWPQWSGAGWVPLAFGREVQPTSAMLPPHFLHDIDKPVVSVPEPSALAVFVAAVVAMVLARRVF